MKKQLIILLISCAITASYSQYNMTGNKLYMNQEQNEEWLQTLQSSSLEYQLILISKRFFTEKNYCKANDSLAFSPLLVIEGINVSPQASIDPKQREMFLSAITLEKVKHIMILNEKPQGNYVYKDYPGIIIVKLKDKRISRKIKKYK